MAALDEAAYLDDDDELTPEERDERGVWLVRRLLATLEAILDRLDAIERRLDVIERRPHGVS